MTVVASAQLCYKIIFLLIPEYAGAMSSMLVLQPGTVKVLRPADSRNRATATYASQPTWPVTLHDEVSMQQEQSYRNTPHSSLGLQHCTMRLADSRNRATATYASQPTWPATLRHEVSRDQEQGYRHVGLTAHLACNIGP